VLREPNCRAWGHTMLRLLLGNVDLPTSAAFGRVLL
jgi:hypothetical protein